MKLWPVCSPTSSGHGPPPDSPSSPTGLAPGFYPVEGGSIPSDGTLVGYTEAPDHSEAPAHVIASHSNSHPQATMKRVAVMMPITAQSL